MQLSRQNDTLRTSRDAPVQQAKAVRAMVYHPLALQQSLFPHPILQQERLTETRPRAPQPRMDWHGP